MTAALLVVACGLAWTGTAWATQPLAELRAAADELVRSELATRSGRLLVEDERLGRVARWMASEALNGDADRAAVRHHLWAEGVWDFEYLPIAVSVDSGDPLAQLRPLLSDSATPWGRYNSVAVAVARRGDLRSVAVLLSRRAASFEETDAESATIRLPADYGSPKLYVTLPDGVVQTRVPAALGDRWLLDLTIDADGPWLFELMAEGPRGPEVLALWPRHRHRSATPPRRRTGPIDSTPIDPADPPDPIAPFPDDGPVAWSPYYEPEGEAAAQPAPTDSAVWVSGAGIGPARRPEPRDARAAEDRLWALIDATRRSRGLISLRRHPGVTRAARRQAREMSGQDGFGHLTSSGTALDRLADEGLTAGRATENIAWAADAAQAHAALMASPSHRANLLDSTVSTAGVGVVVRRDTLGRWSLIVSEVFASLLAEGEGDDWHGAFVNRINDRRGAAGLKPLIVRETLSRLARESLAELMDEGSGSLSDEARKDLADSVRFHFMNAHGIGIDLLITAEPAMVDRIAHGTDLSFTELGVAIDRLTEPVGPHAAGALVVILVFVER